MEAVVLFIITVGLIMTGVLIILLCYFFFFVFAKEVILLTMFYLSEIRIKKKNKHYHKILRNMINIKFKKQMRELRELQVYKEVVSDKKSENFKYPVCF